MPDLLEERSGDALCGQSCVGVGLGNHPLVEQDLGVAALVVVPVVEQVVVALAAFVVAAEALRAQVRNVERADVDVVELLPLGLGVR